MIWFDFQKHFDFRCHLLAFRGKNTTKSWPFKTENNARTLPELLQKNFVKVQKTTFWTHQMVKNDPSKPPK